MIKYIEIYKSSKEKSVLLEKSLINHDLYIFF